jgi:thiamine biosynthesis lipoprotein
MKREYEYTGKAMGTEYAISIVCDSAALAASVSQETITDIGKYEKRFSRFLPNSELSKINHHKILAVSRDFMTVTKRSHDLFVLTKGIFNPLVQISRLGYDKDFSLINNEDTKNQSGHYDIDFSSTTIDEQNLSITLHEGQQLDFGGFLKGYLADILCKKIMRESDQISGAIVNIGGDIHTEGLDAEGNKFVFSIYNPINTLGDIPIALHNQSLATSGTYKRTWDRSGKTIHHILDGSGLENPHSDIFSASVIHPDGGKAEAYAKVFLSAGEKALDLLAEKDVQFAIIKKDGQIIKNFS